MRDRAPPAEDDRSVDHLAVPCRVVINVTEQPPRRTGPVQRVDSLRSLTAEAAGSDEHEISSGAAPGRAIRRTHTADAWAAYHSHIAPQQTPIPSPSSR